MPEKKKQHQIPRVYMKHFSYDGKLSGIFGEFPDLKEIQNIPYKDQCYENFYYGKDLIWENKLEEIESNASKVIEKIMNGEKSLDANEQHDMNRFITFMHERVPFHVDQQIYNRAFMLLKATQMEKFKKPDKNIPELSIRDTITYIQNNQKRQIIDDVLNIAESNCSRLDALCYKILSFNTENRLVFSDNPVLIINDYLIGNQGVGMAGVIIILPLSPNLAYLLFDNRMYSSVETNQISSSNEADVSKINALQIITRQSKVFFDQNNDSRKIVYLFSKKQRERERFLKSLTPIEFGSKENKIILFSTRNSDDKISLSFLKIDTEASCLKYKDTYLPIEFDKKKIKERLESLAYLHNGKISPEDLEKYVTFVWKYYKKENNK